MQTTTIRIGEIPPLVTIEETAKIIRCGQVTTHEHIRSGKLRTVVLGGRRLVIGESILDLIRSAEQTEYQPIRESPRKRAKRAA